MLDVLLGDCTLMVLAVPGPGPEHDVVVGVERQQVAPLLSIAVPKLGPGDDACKRAAGDSGHDTPPGEIQGDHQARPVAKDLTDNGGVVAVDHPRRLGRGGTHPGSELVRVRGSPPGSVVEPVEFDVRNTQIGCKPRREGGLA